MEEDIKKILGNIAAHQKHVIGDSEESVKINFIVPVLECFGHTGLDFEYKYKDIIIKRSLPNYSKVIVETKNYDKDINKELQQLERYCKEEQPLLGIIANGHEIKIFSPSWRFRTPFRNTLIYSIKRENLNDENIINSVEKILSIDNLKSGKAKDSVIERENEIEDAEQKIRGIKEKFEIDAEELNDKIDDLNKKIEVIKSQINDLNTQIHDAKLNRDEQIRGIWDKLGLPVPDLLPVIPPDPPLGGEPHQAGQAGQSVDIVLPERKRGDGPPSWRKFYLIPLPKRIRSFIPGYEIRVPVETDIGELEMYVTGAPEGTQIGDPSAGSYIKGVIKWIKSHTELRPGDMIRFTVIEPPRQRYRLEVVER
ncbi:hypothetical protein C5S31_09135 [ANME-1 cluster archaeon GoMg2]|nr:hypothetical protein [ANME-1 cluster archaeon GoMg2]